MVYSCELESCPQCGGPMKAAYVSGPKTVQTLGGVITMVHRPKRCTDVDCGGHGVVYKSARWQQVAPQGGTYGYDVVAQIGWQRQTQRETYAAIHTWLDRRLEISESQVRYLYHEQYLPLLACQERRRLAQLEAVAAQSGLVLSLDGLVPEGGEPQLWVVRELQTALTLRSGWLSRQDETAFVNFLRPIADPRLPVVAVMSDKQRGLVPAVAAVFPRAQHGYCQMHYLKNAAQPVAEADEAMKVTLRQGVRAEVGELIRQEKGEKPGVLTVTGLLPSPVDDAPLKTEEPDGAASTEAVVEERAAIVQELKHRVRYLLTLKGRPPFRLAGLEMFERLREVEACLQTLTAHHADAQVVQLHQGLHLALQTVEANYTELRQAADWLHRVADILDPEDNHGRSGAQVRQELFAYLDQVQEESQPTARLHALAQKIHQTSLNYAPGLFHCYDDDRESEFRDLNRRLLRTTGQKGLVRRILQREGAWELIPHPDSLRETVRALSQVTLADFCQERQRVRSHRHRFRFHTRSAKQSSKQLEQLEQHWLALPPTDTS